MDKEDKLGGLWVNKEKGYMSGTIGEQRVIIFKNGYKKEDKHPDYIVYKSKPKAPTVTTSEGFMAIPTDAGELPF